MFFTKWLMDTIQLFRNKLTNNWKIKSEIIYEKHAEGTQNLTGQKTDTYSQPCQTSKTEYFAKIIKKKQKQKQNNFRKTIVYIGVSTPPPLKTLSLFLAKPPPPLNQQTVQAHPPFSGIFSPVYWFFVNPPLKVGFFSEPPKY